MPNFEPESSWPTRRLPPDLRYVPHPCLETAKAAAEAVAAVEWIAADGRRGSEPTEGELFRALHACAYRVRRGREGPAHGAGDPSVWLERWRQIREYLVRKHLGLVYAMIGRLGPNDLDEDDLVSDGMLGLARAVTRFDPWEGHRFSTYACHAIFRALLRGGKRQRRDRRLSPVQLGLPVEAPDRQQDARTALGIERLTRALDANLGGLTKLESRIVAERFPSAGAMRPTLRQIGEAIGLSEERVRQIQKTALAKLQAVLNADPLLQ